METDVLLQNGSAFSFHIGQLNAYNLDDILQRGPPAHASCRYGRHRIALRGRIQYNRSSITPIFAADEG